MMSTFLFGGSDIVMVFQRESNVNIMAQVGVHYPIRSQYAYANMAKLKKVLVSIRGRELGVVCGSELRSPSVVITAARSVRGV